MALRAEIKPPKITVMSERYYKTMTVYQLANAQIIPRETNSSRAAVT